MRWKGHVSMSVPLIQWPAGCSRFNWVSSLDMVRLLWGYGFGDCFKWITETEARVGGSPILRQTHLLVFVHVLQFE